MTTPQPNQPFADARPAARPLRSRAGDWLARRLGVSGGGRLEWWVRLFFRPPAEGRRDLPLWLARVSVAFLAARFVTRWRSHGPPVGLRPTFISRDRWAGSDTWSGRGQRELTIFNG